jgi:hypothetical protein
METVTTLARLSKFVIADITDAVSVTQELVSIVGSIPSLPIMPLIENGNKPWGMYDHIQNFRTVINVYSYQNKDDLVNAFYNEVIEKAEIKYEELKELRK